MTKERRVCLGAIAGAHGVRGDIRIKCFTDDPSAIADYGPVETEDGARQFTLKILSQAKGDVAIARAREVTSRDDAIALKGTRLYVKRAALPATDTDEFYIEDLIGMRAVNKSGAPLGEIAAVYNFGAGDLLEIKNIPDVKGLRLIAFTKENVPEINHFERIITLRDDVFDDFDD